MIMTRDMHVESRRRDRRVLLELMALRRKGKNKKPRGPRRAGVVYLSDAP
jgi:hypothetical protein